MASGTDGLRFDVYERVHLPDDVAAIDELEEIELVPRIQVIDQGDQAVLKGQLLLTGVYRSPNSVAGPLTLEHWIPVEISLPMNRVSRLDDISIEIDNFDVDLLSARTLNITGVLSLRGISVEPVEEEQQAAQWEDETFTAVHQRENEEEQPFIETAQVAQERQYADNEAEEAAEGEAVYTEIREAGEEPSYITEAGQYETALGEQREITPQSQQQSIDSWLQWSAQAALNTPQPSGDNRPPEQQAYAASPIREQPGYGASPNQEQQAYTASANGEQPGYGASPNQEGQAYTASANREQPEYGASANQEQQTHAANANQEQQTYADSEQPGQRPPAGLAQQGQQYAQSQEPPGHADSQYSQQSPEQPAAANTGSEQAAEEIRIPAAEQPYGQQAALIAEGASVDIEPAPEAEPKRQEVQIAFSGKPANKAEEEQGGFGFRSLLQSSRREQAAREAAEQQISEQREAEENAQKATVEDEIEWKKLFLAKQSEGNEFRKIRLCIVQREETLEQIALRYSLNPRELLIHNRLHESDIAEGQLLYIP